MSGRPASLSFDRIADRYDETRGGEERGRRFARQISQLLDREGAVLEVGVGTGLVALGLEELGHHVVGVDLSPAMLRYARGRLGPAVIAGDAARLPVRSSSVDQALSVWLLHLVADLGAVLGEIGRVLTPTGRYVVVPARIAEPDDDIGRLVWQMYERLDPERLWDDATPVVDAAPAAGLRVTGRHEMEPDPVDESPEQVARNIETRTMSLLWDVQAPSWERDVVPVIEALRALPNTEEPRHRTVQPRPAIVLERR